MDGGTAGDAAGAGPLAPVRWIDAHPWAAAAAVAAARIATTLPGLGRRSFWLDEVWTAALAAQPVGTIVSVGLHDENPPLYNLLIAAWTSLAGVSEVSLRLPSVFAAAAAAGLLLLVVRRHFGSEAALWATLLLFANPLEWDWAREARAYGLVQLLCVAAWGLFLRLFERPRRATAAGLAAVEALSMATHYVLGFAFAAQAAAALLARRASPLGFRAWLGTQAIAATAVAPLLLSALRAMPTKPESWRPVPGLRDLLELATRIAGRRAALSWGLGLVATWVVLRLAARTASARSGASVQAPPVLAARPSPGTPPPGASSGPGEDWRIGALALWAALPIVLAFAVSQRAPMFLPRYLLFSALGWVAWLGAIVSRLPLPPGARALVACVLAFLAAGGFAKLGGRADWRRAALAAHAARADRALPAFVVTSETGDCLVWAWYAERDALPAVFRRSGPTRFDPDGLERRLAAAGSTCLRPTAFEAVASAGNLPPQAVLLAATQDAPRNEAMLARSRVAGFSTRPLVVPGPFRAAVIERAGSVGDPASRAPGPAGEPGR